MPSKMTVNQIVKKFLEEYLQDLEGTIADTVDKILAEKHLEFADNVDKILAEKHMELLGVINAREMFAPPGPRGERGSKFLGNFRTITDLPPVEKHKKGDFAIVEVDGAIWYIL